VLIIFTFLCNIFILEATENTIKKLLGILSLLLLP